MQPDAESHGLVEGSVKFFRKCPEERTQSFFFRFLPFLDAFFLFLSFLHGLLHAGIRPPSRRRAGRKGIEPSLPAKPVSKLGDESSLFPVPAFLSHAMLKSGVKFRYGRKLTATGQTEPGKPGEAFCLFFGIEIPYVFKILFRRNPTPHRRRRESRRLRSLFCRFGGKGGVFFLFLFVKIIYVART